MGVEIGNLLSDISKRLVYCQDAQVADWHATNFLQSIYTLRSFIDTVRTVLGERRREHGGTYANREIQATWDYYNGTKNPHGNLMDPTRPRVSLTSSRTQSPHRSHRTKTQTP